MSNLSGQTALITGAASGIGRAVALRLAQAGCDIAIVDIDHFGAEETAAMVTRDGRKARALTADVGNFDDVIRTTEDVIGEFGKIDILCNNAGIVHLGTIAETSIEDWEAIFRINVGGVFHFCKAVVPHMTSRGGGRIINMASWYGKIGKPGYGAYCSSKFAVIGLTQSLALEVARHRINVNAICPGTIVETRMRDEADRRAVTQGLPTAREREAQIPLGRVGLPDDIARVALFLASEESSYMTGQSINVTGGLWMH